MAAFLLTLSFLFAALDWLAVHKNLHRLEYFAKPGVMLFLLGWLLVQAGLRGPLVFFGLGLLFSLLGDVLLMISNRRRDGSTKLFLAGLSSFLLAHIAYFIGFNSPPPPFSPLTIGVAAMVIFQTLPLVRRILQGSKNKGLRRLVLPVRIYATLLALMLFSALLTLFRTDWQSIPAYLVSLGAFLFVASDTMLAWNKFVNPIRRGRLLLMILYHLGQIAMITGAAAQFGV